jgi:hypothetical protein
MSHALAADTPAMVLRTSDSRGVGGRFDLRKRRKKRQSNAEANSANTATTA